VRYPYGQDRSPDPDAILPVQTWLLDVKRYGIREHISPWLLETMEVEALREPVFDSLILSLQAKILTKDVNAYDVEAHDQVPASWWDHYKHTLWQSTQGTGRLARADRWLLRLLRLDRVEWRQTTVSLHVHEFVAYPEADPALARTLGRAVQQRIVALPYWRDPFDPSRGDTEDHA
jgi:hypothetical protein